MSMIIIASMIGVLLALVLIFNAISQRKDQLAAEKRQEASQYRFRATETQELLDGLKALNLSSKIRAALVARVLHNLETVKRIAPDYPNIDRSIEFAVLEQDELNKQGAVAAITVDSAIDLPNSSAELKSLLSRIRRMLKMLDTLYQRGKLDAAIYTEESPKIQLLALRLDVETNMKFGRIAQTEGKNGTARQYYQYAYDQLLQSGITSSYSQNQLPTLQQLIDAVSLKIEQEKPKDETKADDLGIVFGEKKKW